MYKTIVKLFKEILQEVDLRKQNNNSLINTKLDEIKQNLRELLILGTEEEGKKALIIYKLIKIPKDENENEKVENFISKKLSSELSSAIKENNEKTLNYLLEIIREAQINQVLINNYTPLQFAIKESETNISTIKAVANKVDIEDTGIAWVTPLHMAIIYNRIEVIRELVRLKVDIDGKGNNGCTPLHVGVQEKEDRLEVIRELVHLGANIEVSNKKGFTPLQLAVQIGKLEVIRELVKLGTNIETLGENGFTPLQLAVQDGKLEVIRELVHLGANIETLGENGFNALHIAAANGQVEVIRELERLGVDIEARDEDGCTALYVAIEHKKVSTVKLLLAKKANIYAANKKDITPLQLAATIKHSVIERLLINKKISDLTPLVERSVYKEDHFIVERLNDLTTNTPKKGKKRTARGKQSNQKPDSIPPQDNSVVKQPQTKPNKPAARKSKNVQADNDFQPNSEQKTKDKERIKREEEKAQRLELERQQLKQERQQSNLETCVSLNETSETKQRRRENIKQSFYSSKIHLIKRSEEFDHEKGRPGIIIAECGDKRLVCLGYSDPPEEYKNLKFLALSCEKDRITHFYEFVIIEKNFIKGKWKGNYELSEIEIEKIVKFMPLSLLDELFNDNKLSESQKQKDKSISEDLESLTDDLLPQPKKSSQTKLLLQAQELTSMHENDLGQFFF